MYKNGKGLVAASPYNRAPEPCSQGGRWWGATTHAPGTLGRGGAARKCCYQPVSILIYINTYIFILLYFLFLDIYIYSFLHILIPIYLYMYLLIYFLWPLASILFNGVVLCSCRGMISGADWSNPCASLPCTPAGICYTNVAQLLLRTRIQSRTVRTV